MLQRRSLQGFGLGPTPPHSGCNINNERGAGITVFIAGTVIHSVSPSDELTDALKASPQQKAGLGR